MSRLYRTGICFLALLYAGCSKWKQSAPVGTPPRSSIQLVDEQDFDLHHLETIVFHLNGETIASIKPLRVTSGTDKPELQFASWDLSFLNAKPIYEHLTQDNALLVINRIRPRHPTDNALQLHLDHLYIHIGGFDNTLVIPRPATSGSPRKWVYYSGAGKVCEGTVSFILKSDS